MNKQMNLFQRDTNRDANRDISVCAHSLRRDEKRDISGVGISDTPPMSRWSSGRVPNVPSGMSRSATDRAYATWVADGRPWPPPAGMLSAIMQPFMPRRSQ